MSPILVTGNVLPLATLTLIPAGALRRLERSLRSPTTWILAPESNKSFGHGCGDGREELLPSSPPGAAAGCADPDAEEAYMSMFAGVPLPPTNAGFSDGEDRCKRARAPGGFRAIVDEQGQRRRRRYRSLVDL
jgi:hypothetical protein